MADADTRIDGLKDDIRVLGYSLLDLQAKVTAHDAKFAQILRTLDEHGAKLDRHDRRFDQVDARLDRVDARLDQVDARLSQMDTRFDHVDATLAEMLTRLPQRPTSGDESTAS